MSDETKAMLGIRPEASDLAEADELKYMQKIAEEETMARYYRHISNCISCHWPCNGSETNIIAISADSFMYPIIIPWYSSLLFVQPFFLLVFLLGLLFPVSVISNPNLSTKWQQNTVTHTVTHTLQMSKCPNVQTAKAMVSQLCMVNKDKCQLS